MEKHWYGIRINTGDKFRIESQGKTIKTIRFKPDEERVAVGYNDGTIEIWDIAAREKTSGIHCP